jgi:hypothetical protein
LEESDLPSDYTKYLQENKSDDDSKYKLLPRHGKCIFFMENNKCYIHDKYGHDAKSRACKTYPLSTSAFSPRGIHLKISFTCDSILRSLLLPDAIRTTSDDWENDLVCTARVQFSVGHSVSWQNFFFINDALASLFLQSAYNIEHNLMLSSIWASDLFNKLKDNMLNEFRSSSGLEYLSANKNIFLEKAKGFEPEYSSQIMLLSDIAKATLQYELMEKEKNLSTVNLMRLLVNVNNTLIDKIKEAYNKHYLKGLSSFTVIIERYFMHKMLSLEMSVTHGIIYGLNKLSLCYAFLRLHLLAKIIFNNEKLNDDDILDSISFVETTFFHKSSTQYLDSPHMLKILLNPSLPLLLIRA